MIINGVELEDIDILNVEDAEAFEEAIEKVRENLENPDNLKGLKQSEVIRKVCTTVCDCCNIIFGEGTDKKVFGDEVHLMTCVQAYEELIQHANKANQELEKFNAKYSSNRAARRSKK